MSLAPRRADFLAARRPAARRAGVRAALRRHGAARPADLAASGAHRGDAGLSGRDRNRASRCGGASAGPTTPRSPWCGWCFAACSTAIPNLKIITHHLGGMIPYLRRPRRTGPGGARPAHLGRGLFADPAVAEAAAPGLSARLLCRHRDVRRRRPGAALRLRFFGADQVVFATDTPLGPIKPAIDALDGAGLSAVDRRKIFSGNAEKLLKKNLS